MMDFEGLAQQLMQHSQGLPQTKLGSFSSADLKQLRRFLKTAAGREATRASIDNVVVRTKNPRLSPNLIPHQDILRSLMYSMGQGNYTQEAVSVDPINVAEGYGRGPSMGPSYGGY